MATDRMMFARAPLKALSDGIRKDQGTKRNSQRKDLTRLKDASYPHEMMLTSSGVIGNRSVQLDHIHYQLVMDQNQFISW